VRLRSDRAEVAARLSARGWVVVAICAFSAAGEAPRRAQPAIHPLCDMRGLGGGDVAARNGCQNGGQHLSKILDRPQRRQIDPETRCRVDGSERRRQELRGEGPQQMRLAVEQIRQRRRAQLPSREIGHAPPWIGNAARPPERIAGASFCETPARVAREAERDQAQVIEIPGIEALGYRRLQEDAGGSSAVSGIGGAPGRTGPDMWVHYTF
jgi:hypothetical protein